MDTTRTLIHDLTSTGISDLVINNVNLPVGIRRGWLYILYFSISFWSQIANRDKLCAETDTVHVHVCKFVQKPNCVTGEYVVKRLQIFPGPMPEDTFEIAWSDINAGFWKKAKVDMGLPNDTPQPVCRINFHEFV